MDEELESMFFIYNMENLIPLRSFLLCFFVHVWSLKTLSSLMIERGNKWRKKTKKDS